MHCHRLIEGEEEPIQQLKNLSNNIVMKQMGLLSQLLVGIDSQNLFLMFNGQMIYKRSITNGNSSVQYASKVGYDVYEVVSSTGVTRINGIKQIADPLSINILSILSGVLH